MKPSQVLANLRTLLSYEDLESLARATGAHTRHRKLHPLQMLEAMLASVQSSGGRLADTLRMLEYLHGVKVHRASFYKRLNAEFAEFVHQVTERMLGARIIEEQPKLRGVLESFRDVWAWDSTCIGLRRQLAESFAVGAQSERAGAKLHGAISLRSQAIVRPRITAQKVHDARGIDLGNKLEDVLVLLDRGYSGHRLFADIVEGGGAFLTRLKTSTNPRILMAHSPAEEVAGKTLDEALEAEELDLDEPIDLDVELTVERIGSLDARVIGIPVENEEGTELWWYLTSLDREEFPPATIELLYRLRWQVELLWKQLKSRFRLHEVSAITDHNVRLIMETAVLAHVLSLGVMDAVTTRTERKKLTVGRMALAFPYALPNLLSILFDDEEEEEKEEKARKFRRAVLSSASDTNPKRTRQSALRRAKRARKSRSARAKS